jgi:hypothetical protein
MNFEHHDVKSAKKTISGSNFAAVGVDEMFIMSSAWHRTSPLLAPVDRLALTVGEAAVSITITSFTDALSFAIGTWTNLASVR